MVEISIVMPLYNAVKYLREALESILCQSFKNFELICINDASTDATMDILRDFKKRDDRIRVFSNEERCGAASSRNKGMGAACGKYLAFLDGDDIFDKRMLEKAYFTIKEKKADIVMYEYQHVPSDSIHCKLQKKHGQRYKEKYCKKVFSVQECEPYEIINWTLAPWNKLYRRDFIQENELLFQDLSCANDIYFVCMALMLSEKTIVLDDEMVMVYARDHYEPHRISYSRDSMCNYKALMKIGQELVRRDKFGQLYECFYYSALFSLKDGLIADKNKARAEAFYNFLQREGLDSLRLLNSRCYDNMDEYIRREMAFFTEKSFASGWYIEENALKVYLYKKSKEVIDLYNRLRSAGAKIAIWGAGANGTTLLKFCIQHNLEITALIDRSKERQGSLVQGYMIISPEEALDKVQVIVISARLIYEEVIKEVGGRKIEVIDINQFLCLT
ncbi:MAG: glycosyltransferase family 2 protein [Lachnospiraceae bacterium]|nr:glycosyltransferase family 2 protein [Lachnospiraceae bacterium]